MALDVENSMKHLFALETKFSDDLAKKRLNEIETFIGKKLNTATPPLPEKKADNLDNASQKCDIYVLAEDGTGVIIENQFGDSDHDHLGKLITYVMANAESDGVNVTCAVWISERFHIEHIITVDRINALCKEKLIDFKIITLGVRLRADKNDYEIKNVDRDTKDFICQRRDAQLPHKEQSYLDELMPRIEDQVIRCLKDKCSKFNWSRHCAEMSIPDNTISIIDADSCEHTVNIKRKFNIPYRDSEKCVKVELKLFKSEYISEHYQDLLDSFDSSYIADQLYDACFEVQKQYGESVKSLGFEYSSGASTSKPYYKLSAAVLIDIHNIQKFDIYAQAVAQLATYLLTIADTYISSFGE